MEKKDKYLVFIVDDEPIFLEMVKDELMENPKLEVMAFENGEECIDNLHLNPDIVILDHNLDRKDANAKNGMETLDDIRRKKPETNIIILSGQLLPDVTFDFIMKKEVTKYIVKGENAFDDLKEVVNELVG